jgi:hypothetical protein
MSLKIINFSDGYGSETAPSIVDVSGSKVEYITLTAANISLGYVELGAASTIPENSMLSWAGINQTYNVDFYVSGSQLSLLARLLTEVAEGDYLTLYYQ